VRATPVTRAIAYLRVSTDQQAESGLGLEAQEAAVQSAAFRLRLTIARTFVDGGTSGKLGIEDRPVLLEAVAALRRGDVLLVAKRDRIGRDVIVVAMIERLVAKRDARVISAAGEGTESDDPAGVLMRRLIDSFSEYERLIISARTRAALAAKRRRGERVSGIVPFGYRLAADGRTLEVHARRRRPWQRSSACVPRVDRSEALRRRSMRRVSPREHGRRGGLNTCGT
jgi:site-specific DNA recombinase